MNIDSSNVLCLGSTTESGSPPRSSPRHEAPRWLSCPTDARTSTMHSTSSPRGRAATSRTYWVRVTLS